MSIKAHQNEHENNFILKYGAYITLSTIAHRVTVIYMYTYEYLAWIKCGLCEYAIDAHTFIVSVK